MEIEVYIKKFNPCSPSRSFLRKFETFEEAWKECPSGDWLLSTAKLLGVDTRTLILAKGLCANTVRHLMKDPRSIAAVDAAIAFGKGEIGEEELKNYAPAYASAYASVDSAADIDATRTENQKQTADICRKVLTRAVMDRIEKRL